MRHTLALFLVLSLVVGCAPVRRAGPADIAYAVTGAADLYTTHRALDHGLHETNPALQWTDDDPWTTVYGGAVIKLGVWFLVDFLHSKGALTNMTRACMLSVFSTGQSWAAWHNYQLTLDEIEEDRAHP